MKKIAALLCLIVIPFVQSCSLNEEGDREIILAMTIYSDTSFSGYVMAEDVYGEFLVFSENNNPTKYILTNGAASFDDFTYEKGYEYVLEVKKTYLANPPQDGSSIQYEYLKTLTKEKVVTQDSEELLEIEVGPEKVSFIPRDENELQEALLTKDVATGRLNLIVDVEDFNYEEGFTYQLSVKKLVQAEPYAVKYRLVEILSMEEF